MIRHLILLLALVCHNPPVVASELMQRGARLNAIADELEAEAGASIQRGGEIRKTVEKARFARQKLPPQGDYAPMEALIRDQARQMSHWQAQGSKLRRQAAGVRAEAVALLKLGMVKKWQPWITITGPLQALSGDAATLTAHNIQMRSVHPQMRNLEKSPDLRRRDDMSLEISALAGQQIPAALDTASFSLSRDRRYFAHIEVHPEKTGGNQTNTGSQVPLNQLHTWRLVLSRLNGEAVSGANITFGGHMPGHVHGLPTQPQITAELAPGVYRVEGVKFQMSGWWVIDFAVTTGEASGETTADNIRFNLML